MRLILIALASISMMGCATYKGSEFWRRSACEQSVDAGERAQCLEEATRSENDYKQDVVDARIL